MITVIYVLPHLAKGLSKHQTLMAVVVAVLFFFLSSAEPLGYFQPNLAESNFGGMNFRLKSETLFK